MININDPRLKVGAVVRFKPDVWRPITNFEIPVGGLIGDVTCAQDLDKVECPLVGVRLRLNCETADVFGTETSLAEILEPWEGEVQYAYEDVEQYLTDAELITEAR